MRKDVEAFTLIEILIVIFIISIVSGVALLSISRNENRQVEIFSNELLQLLSLAQEEAILQPGVLGLLIDQESLRFASYQESTTKNKTGDGSKTNNKEWVFLQNKILGKASIPPDLRVRIQLSNNIDSGDSTDQKNTMNTPQIIISPNGELTPFTIYIGKKSNSPRYVIKGDVDGNISKSTLS